MDGGGDGGSGDSVKILRGGGILIWLLFVCSYTLLLV
jgi:hypothetical protein